MASEAFTRTLDKFFPDEQQETSNPAEQPANVEQPVADSKVGEQPTEIPEGQKEAASNGEEVESVKVPKSVAKQGDAAKYAFMKKDKQIKAARRETESIKAEFEAYKNSSVEKYNQLKKHCEELEAKLTENPDDIDSRVSLGINKARMEDMSDSYDRELSRNSDRLWNMMAKECFKDEKKLNDYLYNVASRRNEILSKLYQWNPEIVQYINKSDNAPLFLNAFAGRVEDFNVVDALNYLKSNAKEGMANIERELTAPVAEVAPEVKPPVVKTESVNVQPSFKKDDSWGWERAAKKFGVRTHY